MFLRAKLRECLRVAGRVGAGCSATQFPGHRDDVGQLHCAFDRRVTGQYLFDQRRAGTRQADDENGVGRRRAKTGAGLELLTAQLKEFLGMKNLREDVFIARRRHLEALERAGQSLHEAKNVCAGKHGTELLAEHLRNAQHALGEITGVYAADDLLGEIFSRFCLGK